MLPQLAPAAFDRQNHTIRGGGIVLGEMLPDADEIVVGAPRPNDGQHSQRPPSIRPARRRATAITSATDTYGLGPLSMPSRARTPSSSTEDRKGVVMGKSVSVHVDIGGRRLIKNKNNKD